MTTAAHCGPRSFANDSALPQSRRVKLVAGILALANAHDDEIGVMEGSSFDTDAVATVRLPATHETIYLTASEAVPKFANV